MSSPSLSARIAARAAINVGSGHGTLFVTAMTWEPDALAAAANYHPRVVVASSLPLRFDSDDPQAGGSLRNGRSVTDRRMRRVNLDRKPARVCAKKPFGSCRMRI